MPSSAKRSSSRGRDKAKLDWQDPSKAKLDWQDPSSGCYSWKIDNFSRLTEKMYYSDVFTIGGCKWRILIYPKGIESEYFAIYLSVPDAASLPKGWSREGKFSLTMINQNNYSSSITRDFDHVFNAHKSDCWGYSRFSPLSGLQIRGSGFLVYDTVIVKAEVHVRVVVPDIVFPRIVVPDRMPLSLLRPVVTDCQVTEMNTNAAPAVVDTLAVTETNPSTVPPVLDFCAVTEMNRVDSFFTKLHEFIVTAEIKEGSSSNNGSNNQMRDLISGSPGFEEVEEAKQSLKECLSDIFELGMKDRLAAALLTLTRAEFGLSSDQQKSIRVFWDNFDDFVTDFLTFEQANSDFELQKLTRDQMFSTMKKKHETHISNKQLLEALTNEEEDLKKRMEQLKSRKERLVSDWETLVAKSEELKSSYTAQEKMLSAAEQTKRISEERMSRSTAAWSSLKEQFLSEEAKSNDMARELGDSIMLSIYPKGNNVDHFSIYLDVPDSATLPTGWRREACFSLTMLNQDSESSSTKKETSHAFNAKEADWGFVSFKPLSELHNRRKGFLVNDTLIVEVEVDVQSGVPPVVVPEADDSLSNNVALSVVTETTRFQSFFCRLGEFIVAAEDSSAKQGSGSKSCKDDQMDDLTCGKPSLDEVEEAKQSLKECLSDLFKLNMKGRLSAALLTLSRAEVGLSSDQKESIKNFRENFDDFVSDFLTFEQDNAEFELQRLARDQVFSAMKKKHNTHLSMKQLLESLATEEEELNKRMEEFKAKKEKLISDWQSLMTESEEAQSKYTAQEKKLAATKEKKRIAEERMSRSAAAWSSLKAHFV